MEKPTHTKVSFKVYAERGSKVVCVDVGHAQMLADASGG